MPQLGLIEDFKKFFIRLLEKQPRKIPEKVFLGIQKGFGQTGVRYLDTGKPLKIISIECDGQKMVLDDYSQWAVVSGFGLGQTHALYWSPGETVIVSGGSGNVRPIQNLAMGETSRWVFQGYIE